MANNTYLASIYRLTGTNFWESAKKLDATMEKHSDSSSAKIAAIPVYFLISHAIELFLKSALLKRGWSKSDLKKFDYRHNLELLMVEIQKLGVVITPETVEIVTKLSEQHFYHSLRYSALTDDGIKTYMPPTGSVNSVLEELLSLTRISTQGV